MTKEFTKALLAARRSLELDLLVLVQDWEKETGLCVSGVYLQHNSIRNISTSKECTGDVRVEVLL